MPVSELQWLVPLPFLASIKIPLLSAAAVFAVLLLLSAVLTARALREQNLSLIHI